MGEFLSPNRYNKIIAGAAALAGVAAIASCGASEQVSEFRVGVVCPDTTDSIDVIDVSNKAGRFNETKTISLSCGQDQSPVSMELLSGKGVPTIDDGTDFTGIVTFSTAGPDTRKPVVDLNINHDSAAGQAQVAIQKIWTIENVQVTEQPTAQPNLG